ncbi:MAG TPA: CRTAC1 family protein [Candidatus Polarisedimenticolia bacterium]|nr:CRTAC1 family protein [Candidatus Polarisedimenticolia bacterium]
MKRALACLLLAAGLLACRGDSGPAPPVGSASAPKAKPAPSPFRFEEVSRQAGIRFVHRSGASPEKYMAETMGSGVCVLDFDGDGWGDLYFVQSGDLRARPGTPPAGSVLYRNRGDGTFEDVTTRAGVAATGYGMGCTSADIDNDGDADLFVTAYRRETLFRNNGDGTFTDATAAGGIRNASWGTSAAFGDYDRDGLPDLYIVNYVDFTPENNVYCGDMKPGYRTYCHPQTYSGLPDVLYHNLGGGRFEDVSRKAGIADPSGKGLGIVWGDFDADGWVDLYVANDSTPNFLYHNNGDGTFTDIAGKAGAALSEDGMPQAGMGVAAGDCDGDGREEVFVTNLSQETNSLYRNLGSNLFADESYASGLGAPSLLALGFGTDFLDADLDADLDMFVSNGHILDNVELYSDTITYKQTAMMFENLGGCRFRDVSAGSGDYFLLKDVGRGSAVLDFDHDGDPDLAIASNNLPAHLLRNDSERHNRNYLALGLAGRKGSDALGAVVRVPAGGRVLYAERRSASSYLSQSDSVLLFGLGEEAQPRTVEVRWPGGKAESFAIPEVDRYYLLQEGSGSARAAPAGAAWRKK